MNEFKQEAKSETTSPERLEELANLSHTLAGVVAANPTAPAELLDKLGKKRSLAIQKALVSNPNTPTIKDNNIEVRCAAALNSNLNLNIAIKILNKTIEELRQVDSSLNKDIRQSIAFDENVPLIILENLIDDKDVVIRKAVAANPNTPVSILKQLAATDDDIEVFWTILRHPKCSINVKRIIFDRLSQYRKPSLARLTVLLNNYADSKLLACNVNSTCWLERYAISQNAQTPTRTLKKLVEDANYIVRAAAIDNLLNR